MPPMDQGTQNAMSADCTRRHYVRWRIRIRVNVSGLTMVNPKKQVNLEEQTQIFLWTVTRVCRYVLTYCRCKFLKSKITYFEHIAKNINLLYKTQSVTTFLDNYY